VKPGTRTFTRRELIGMGVAGVGASLISGCGQFNTPDAPPEQELIDPILFTRVTPPKTTALKGTTIAYSDTPRDAVLYVPQSYQPSVPAPFVLMLDGENSVASVSLSLFQPYADANGLVLLAVESALTTWDIVAGDAYGPDVAFINGALAAAFNEVNVDPARVTVEGFSDGGSYALAVGLTNGALFSRVVAFSPKYLAPYTPNGPKPKFFVSDGINDPIIDITDGGDFINSTLVGRGYDVNYVRFNGVHEIPDAVVQQAIAWMGT
jgi:phospholipase/carboxylesterase